MMPRVRRRGHTLRGELTSEQTWCLVAGVERTGCPAFATDADYERAWWFHRDELMASVNPTTRPDAWWSLEFKGERKPGEKDWEVLERAGLLTVQEQHLVEKWGLREHTQRVRALKGQDHAE
jgi:hypothetical protein